MGGTGSLGTFSSVASVQAWTRFLSCSQGPSFLYSACPAVSLLVSVCPESKVPIWYHKEWRVVESVSVFPESQLFQAHWDFFISPFCWRHQPVPTFTTSLRKVRSTGQNIDVTWECVKNAASGTPPLPRPSQSVYPQDPQVTHMTSV